MLIGIDLDNTLVGYDELLHALAIERGVIPAEFPPRKILIRERIRQDYGDVAWQRLQAAMYGERMHQAILMDGAGAFLEQCAKHQLNVHIISHKTEFSNLPKAGTDLAATNLAESTLAKTDVAEANFRNFRTAAWQWLEQRHFFTRLGLTPLHVHFTSTRQEKVRKIKELGCTHFIDDLVEVFQEGGFPAGVTKILFRPAISEDEVGPGGFPDIPGMMRMKDWREIHDYFF